MKAERWVDVEVAMAAAALIAVGVLTFGSLGPPRATPPPTGTELIEFERQAMASCECEARGEEKCWDAFMAKAEARGAQFTGSACDPISSVVACFGDGATEPCAFMKYSYRGGRRSVALCNKADAQAVERAWSSTYERAKSPEEADREASRVVAAILRGDRVEMAGGRAGCAG